MALVLEDAFLPATLSADPMTDEESVAFCDEHPDLTFETAAGGEIVVTPPTNPMSGDRNSVIGRQLRNWMKKDGRGRTYDSSAYFVLPNGARRSPDASWISKAQYRSTRPSRSGEVMAALPGFCH